jgi:hypothetical protein
MRYFKPTGEKIFLTFLLLFTLFPISQHLLLSLELHKLIPTVKEAGDLAQKQETMINQLFLFILLLCYAISCSMVFFASKPKKQNKHLT